MTERSQEGGRTAGTSSTLVDRAYDLIRRRISEAEPSPLVLLSELSLSRDLAIGRTPVREALQKLASQGLVTIVPRRGAAISRLGQDEALQAVELRSELDPAIAVAAALRATFRQRSHLIALADALRSMEGRAGPADAGILDTAYEAVRDACANPHLRRAAEAAHAIGYRTVQRAAADMKIPGRVAELCEAIADGDADGARRHSLAALDAIGRHARLLPVLPRNAAESGDDDAPSLTSTAYLQIEAKIVSGELRPGTWLSQSQLAKLLDVGKTPIREATLRLAADHLVEISPRKGILVAEVDFSDRFQVLEARRPLERALSVRCAAKITKKDATELRRMGRRWVAAAEQGDNAAVQMVDQTAKTLLLSVCASPLLRHAVTPIFTLSRRLYFRMLKTPNVEIARGYASWLDAIAAGDGRNASKIAGFIAAEAEHLLNAVRT